MLSDYQLKVISMVRDNSGIITPEDTDTAISDAVLHYSVDNPFLDTEDKTAIDGVLQSLPTKWISEFSRIDSIEYPSGQFPPKYLNRKQYQVYQAPDGDKLIMPEVPAGEIYRISWTGYHRVTDVNDTVPLTHRVAVCSYAAALLCEQLATYYAGQSDGGMIADSVNHNDKAKKFRMLAKNYKDNYLNAVGAEEKRPAGEDNPGGGFSTNIDFDRADSRGRQRWYHSGRYR